MASKANRGEPKGTGEVHCVPDDTLTLQVATTTHSGTHTGLLPSDTRGYIYIAYQKSIKVTANELAKEMGAAGVHQVPATKIH